MCIDIRYEIIKENSIYKKYISNDKSLKRIKQKSKILSILSEYQDYKKIK